MNGNGLPVWAKSGAVGVIGFLLMFLLGAIPGLPSPITRLQESVTLHAQESKADVSDVKRAAIGTCHGVWRDEPESTRTVRCGRLP